MRLDINRVHVIIVSKFWRWWMLVFLLLFIVNSYSDVAIANAIAPVSSFTVMLRPVGF